MKYGPAFFILSTSLVSDKVWALLIFIVLVETLLKWPVWSVNVLGVKGRTVSNADDNTAGVAPAAGVITVRCFLINVSIPISSAVQLTPSTKSTKSNFAEDPVPVTLSPPVLPPFNVVTWANNESSNLKLLSGPYHNCLGDNPVKN